MVKLTDEKYQKSAIICLMNHNVVPLVEVAEHTDYVRLLDLDLPGVPVDRLDVDLTRLEKVMHWGGVHVLSVGSYYGDASEVGATSLSVNPDGTMSASKEKIKKRAKITAPESQNLDNAVDFRWRNTAVYFNSTGLAERTPDPNEQAKLLDRSLRKSLGADISTHELGLGNVAREVGTASLFAAVSKLVPGNPVGSWDWEEILLLACMPKLLLPVTTNIFHNLRGKDNNPFGLKPKYSTMWDFKFDRAMLAGRHLSRSIITLADANSPS